MLRTSVAFENGLGSYLMSGIARQSHKSSCKLNDVVEYWQLKLQLEFMIHLRLGLWM